MKDGKRVGSRNNIFRLFPQLESLKIFFVEEHIILSKKILSDILLQFVWGYAIIWAVLDVN